MTLPAPVGLTLRLRHDSFVATPRLAQPGRKEDDR